MSNLRPNNSLVLPPSSRKNQQQSRVKQKVLVWSDCVLATTGFGTVSKNILKALHETGKYEIDQLAINYFGDFYDKKEVPYTLVPAKLGDPKDPYGNQMFIDSLLKKDYDIVFVINDTFVVESVTKHIDKIRNMKRSQGKKAFKLVYYYPVDCYLLKKAASMIKIADRAVAYTEFARDSTLKVEGCEPTDVIYHGTDTKVYHPLTRSEQLKFRQDYLNVKDPNRFIFMNVNRNSVRKDIARTILAFSEFRKHVPNSCLYLHTIIQDGANGHMTDLSVPLEELGFNSTHDVIFPKGYSASKGFPDFVLNRLYNCADATISTNLGEGWGLSCGSNTHINTSEGIKFLKDIQIGDKVLTSNGEYEEVLDTTNREEAVVYELEPKFSPPIITSELHPYLASKNKGATLEWLNVKKLKVGDHIAIVKPKDIGEFPESIDLASYIDCKYDTRFVWHKMGFSPKRAGLSISQVQKEFDVSKRVAEDALNKFRGKDIKSRCKSGSQAFDIYIGLLARYDTECIVEPIKMNRHIPVDDMFLEFIGWYLAEGSSENGIRIELSLHKKERYIAEKFQSWCKEILGIDSIVEDFDNKSRLRISNKILANFMQQECGKGSFNKHIPSWLIENPTKLGPLLRGLVLGDGCFCKSGYVSLHTTSPSLAFHTRDICASVGILTAIREDKIRIGNYVPYIVSFKHRKRLGEFIQLNLEQEKKEIDCIELENYFLVPIKSITRSEDNLDLLYDICVDNAHSFVANGILAHNTLTESMAAGTPVVTGNHTTAPELFGKNGERGYIYDCKEKVYVDNSGYRKWGRMDDILEQMLLCHKDWMEREKTKKHKNIVVSAQAFTKKYSWENVCQKWVKLFSELEGSSDKEKEIRGEVL